MKIRYAQIALLLVGILLVSLGLTAVCGVQQIAPAEDTLSVVASFYPIYTATLRVVGDSDGVTVRCLTQPTTGCLHDHQLTPAERAVLDSADVLILNGAGAEEFLDAVLPQLTATTVDTSAWAIPDEEPLEHDGHTHAQNEHIWLDPAMYTVQVNTIRDALCEADPANAEQYRQNAAAYTVAIADAAQELADAGAKLSMDKALLFHDSMEYLAEALGLEVLGTLPIGEDEGFSAAEVAEAADALRGQNAVLLYDDQYPLQMTQLADYAEHSVAVSLCGAATPVSGVEDRDIWLWCMEENAKRLQETAK